MGNNSGIHSLAGFAYQTKVFAYYAFQLTENERVEFETIEDVNIKKVIPEMIDKLCETTQCKIMGDITNRAVQVKHTTLTTANKKQLIMNWILLENDENKIVDYILFTDKSYGNKDDLFKVCDREFYYEISSSNSRSDAIISKVKNLGISSYEVFEEITNTIKNKYKFISLDNIEDEIVGKASLHFRLADNKVVFEQRLNEFLQYITAEIMNAVSEKTPFILSFEDFISKIEDISTRFTKNVTVPSYSEFKKVNDIDLNDSEVGKTREYKQLVHCELPDNLIKKQLLYGIYYKETALQYMENNRPNRVENILLTTKENFDDIKFRLERIFEDTPVNRLDKTQQCTNSYADNEQIKYGSAIYLTNDEVGENQISWKDEDNE